jgi:outer membrane protein assembly factor BamB
MFKNTARVGLLLIAASLLMPDRGVKAIGLTFAFGDLFVSLENGPVQWRLPDGTLYRILLATTPGTAEGMAFDAAGNLYVTRWCVDPFCGDGIGNTVEAYNTAGVSIGSVGAGYCSPHAIVFDDVGYAHVGQAGCTGEVLRFAPGFTAATAYPVVPEFSGSFWIDLASDRCRLFYTSFGPNVKRYDLCTRTQLPDFNVAPLPGGIAQDLRVLPDGGVLVSSGQVIVRLDASGAVRQTYEIPGEGALWAGLDLVGDGTFWAGNYFSSNVYRFDLASGAALTGFNAGTPPNSVVGVRVKK